MNNPLKQSTAFVVKLGPFTDNAGNLLPSLTIAQANIFLSKNGGTFANTHNTAGATYDAHGYYSIPLDVSDTATLGPLMVMVDMSGSGARPIHREFVVLAAAVYNALVATPSTAFLAVNASKIGGQSVTAGNPITAGAYLGTAQPLNFTGSSASALVQVDLAGWAGAALPAVGTSTLTITDVETALANYHAAKASDIPGVVTIADTVLARNVASAEAAAPRASLATAILAMTNKANTSDHAGFLTVYRTDGVSEHARIPIAANPNAVPIEGVG
jgi:hypothetical protein